jgi:DNA-binding CsgD family transcriptional regulator
MSKSGQLRSRDVRAVFEIVGECRELGDDRVAWRSHLMGRLAGLADADLGLKGEMAGCLAGKNTDLGVVFWAPGGFTPPAYWSEHLARFRDDPGYSPALTDYHRLTRADRGRALSRADFIADRDWYGSHDFLKINEPLGVDSILWCFRPIPVTSGDESTGLILARDKGRRDFSARDRAMAREVHAAISGLVGGLLARFSDPSPRDLSPRVREVLACLLEGDGDKQVAARLGMSAYTVNHHTKAIFRHFRVKSRPELLARWIRRGWGSRFSWAD